MPSHKTAETKTCPSGKVCCITKAASEKDSLKRSKKINDKGPCFIIGQNISDKNYSVNDVTALLGETCKVSDKTIHMYNRITVRTKVSYEERLVLVAKGNAEDQRLDEFQDHRSEPGSKPIEEPGTYSKREKNRSNKNSVVSKISTARRVLYLITKALKEHEELQT